jgi:hypothetical protein
VNEYVCGIKVGSWRKIMRAGEMEEERERERDRESETFDIDTITVNT